MDFVEYIVRDSLLDAIEVFEGTKDTIEFTVGSAERVGTNV